MRDLWFLSKTKGRRKCGFSVFPGSSPSLQLAGRCFSLTPAASAVALSFPSAEGQAWPGEPGPCSLSLLPSASKEEDQEPPGGDTVSVAAFLGCG